jgi:hypothetical protein
MAPRPTTPIVRISVAATTRDPSGVRPCGVDAGLRVEAAAPSDLVDPRVDSDEVRERPDDHQQADDDESDHGLMVPHCADQHKSGKQVFPLVNLIVYEDR